ncbi:MAG: hypothetical protein ACI8VT_002140, partial [Saprospiraceae bacterium]
RKKYREGEEYYNPMHIENDLIEMKCNALR